MKREEERIKREEELFGKMERVKPPNKLILEEELKPKKKLSEQICEEEKAIKEMEQLLVDLDGDETEVFKKMQQLNNWRVEIETIKDVNQYAIKSAKLNDVILILEDQLHLLKNGSARTAAQLADKTEKLTKMRADYELIMASGISEEDVETNELLKQFLPTLGLPPDTIVGVDLELEDIDDDHSTSSSPCNSAPPRCRNPVATQLLRETESRKQKPAVTAASAMPDILHEYRDTLKRDSKMVKKNKAGVRSNDDGLRRFMQSQIKKGTSK